YIAVAYIAVAYIAVAYDAVASIAVAMVCNSHGYPAVGRSGSVYAVAVTRDSDGAVLPELRGHRRRLKDVPGAR
ncbi:MAG: paaI, partial [Blastococcus sp.]|nr:paaI [Blastococcus sp.]